MSPTRCLAAALLLGTLVACGGSGSEMADRGRGSRSSTGPIASATPRATPELDSIAVLGHSGATGFMSDAQDPWRDATENSWATGENPVVRSIYQRLAQQHPAMRGHNYNYAVNGTKVNNIETQLHRLLAEVDPLPDVVIVQTTDNDMRCDGSDPENHAAFGSTLNRMLRLVQERVPDVALFLVSRWATEETWATLASRHPEHVAANSGSGPCDVFTSDGKVRREGVRSKQSIVDGYWAEVEECARRCRTATPMAPPCRP